MIQKIYQKYFQKSLTFLYPQLGFKKNKHPKPVDTFLFLEGTDAFPSERRLYCLYEKLNTDEWRLFETEYLITHSMLESCVPIDDKYILYVFDFNPMAEDYDAFLKGKYSLFSTASKKRLTDYYGTHTPEWVYIESFMYPAKYFKQYASILGIEEDTLREVGELCDRFDSDKEKLSSVMKNNTFTLNQ